MTARNPFFQVRRVHGRSIATTRGQHSGHSAQDVSSVVDLMLPAEHAGSREELRLRLRIRSNHLQKLIATSRWEPPAPTDSRACGSGQRCRLEGERSFPDKCAKERASVPAAEQEMLFLYACTSTVILRTFGMACRPSHCEGAGSPGGARPRHAVLGSWASTDATNRQFPG